MRIKNKKYNRGDMSIFGACISLALILLFTPVFEFLYTNEKTNIISGEIQSFVEDNTLYSSIVVFDDNKNYTFDSNTVSKYEQSSNIGYFSSSICEYMKLKYDSDTKWSAVSGKYYIDNIELSYKDDNSTLVITFSYTINIPFTVLGKTVHTKSVNKTVTAVRTYK